MKERRWHVSEIESISKENQEIYDANQRKLNSLKLELVKLDKATWLHFFWGQSHLSKSQWIWILMIAITLQIENVILDLPVQINAHKIRSYFWCHMYYKWHHSLHQVMQVSQTWMNEWMFIYHAINSITGQSMDVKIIVAKRPRETSWLISGAPHTVCLSLIKITLGNLKHISLCNCCYSTSQVKIGSRGLHVATSVVGR